MRLRTTRTLMPSALTASAITKRESDVLPETRARPEANATFSPWGAVEFTPRSYPVRYPVLFPFNLASGLHPNRALWSASTHR